MVNLLNCVECNKLFNKIGNDDICHACRKKDDDLLREISRFIRRKKERVENIEVILDNFDVSEEKITKWIREKKLHTSNLRIDVEKCKMCGIKISSEGLCFSCSKELKKDLNMIDIRESIDKEKENSRIYYKNNKNNN